MTLNACNAAGTAASHGEDTEAFVRKPCNKNFDLEIEGAFMEHLVIQKKEQEDGICHIMCQKGLVGRLFAPPR